jgi:YD repeat-containing protein
VFNLCRFDRSAWFGVQGCAFASDAGRDLTTYLGTHGYATLKLEGTLDQQLRPGKINGQTVDMVMDTGSDRTIITRRCAERLGLKVIDTKGYDVGAGGLAKGHSGTSWSYDAGNRVVKMVDPKGQVTTMTYDLRAWKITQRDPLGRLTQWSYDAVGNPVKITRPDGGVIRNTYDSMNRLLTTTDPKSETTTNAYDSARSRTFVTVCQYREASSV